MDQKKIGQFIKELRKEKGITQEKLAERLKVSGRTVSRWETGSNMPDISLLVEIADFFDVDVRELIEGERKSEMMDEEVREVATKMADYADEEKGTLLKRIQITSFVGVIISILSIGWQFFISSSTDTYEFKLSIFISFIILGIMAVITLYVTGLLEKLVKNKLLMLGIKIITIASLAIVTLVILFYVGCFFFAMLIFAGDIFFSRIQTHTDIENYSNYIGENAVAEYSSKWGMDESIFPDKISDSMQIDEFSFTYYNPWDAEYVGYLTVTYSQDEYDNELERLSGKRHDKYEGLYSVSGEPKNYSVLAMETSNDWGFIYALTPDSHSTSITYVEVVFPGKLEMKLDKYLPKQYQLDGMDVN